MLPYLLDLLGGGCAGGPPPGLQVLGETSRERVVVVESRGAAFVGITSPRGIGRATLARRGTRWPNPLVVGLRYAEGKPFDRLESFVASSPTGSWRWSPSPWQGGSKPEVEVPDGSVKRLREAPEGFLLVSVPELPEGLDSVLVSWVDAYRD